MHRVVWFLLLTACPGTSDVPVIDSGSLEQRGEVVVAAITGPPLDVIGKAIERVCLE